ncbi:hypothetical protein EKO23_02830 [Nocardioides guangzhouensis]|uniref:Uncharacterized protein n=1 Tax=Nocardioides guangzhouensis TaxID=2497878 RepID=A0A4Q4ZL82_9ACTN|nr:hypothetical protein [Nocardioides guangzhouensis]RYP88286.1 hypothetical protein EKO23_02830 [Nocardioides guangzhouensis]
MVSAVENRSMVTVVTLAVDPSDTPHWQRLRVRIDDAIPVEGYAHLLADAVGRELSALAPDDLARLIAVPGSTWAGEAELVAPATIRLRALAD